MRWVALLLLAGCDSLYYQNVDGSLAVREHVFVNSDSLAEACHRITGSWEVKSCATVEGRVCHLYLPERYGPNDYDHELTHCYGRKDAPN